LSAALPWQTLRQTALTLAAIVGFVAGAAASAAALGGYAEDGVVPDASAKTIVSVSPTGFAWRDGIRPGQRVVSIATTLAPGGWRLETTDGDGSLVSRALPVDEALRASLGIGLVGLLLGALAVLFRNTHRHWVAPAASGALLASSTPLFLAGNPELSTLALGGAVYLPTIWLAARAPGGRLVRLALAAAATIFVVAWAMARLSGFSGFDALEAVRAALATLAVGLLVIDRVLVPILSREPMHMSRPRMIDAAAVSLMAGGSLALVYYLAISPILVGAAIVVMLVALPRARRWLSAQVKLAVLTDIRAEAALEAAEEERARMARELHDVPLQHLSGVIRRLELVPAAQAESDELRIVAGQLRTVATNLRPPVLDDLGLGAALSFLAEEATSATLPVVTELIDGAGLDAARRPPSAVELAIFRIAQEAVTNALRHAAATEVAIRGDIDPDHIDLVIADDGSGLSPPTIRAAGRRGRLGLASMRRRAEAIDAELSIAPGNPGTRVRIVWQR
jgi:signal transduction histidine kinase